MGCPEVKVLRDALAREIALRQKSEARVADLERLLGERDGTIEEQAVIITEQDGMISDLSKRMGLYENPHTPPSQGSIPGEKRKREQRKDPAEHKRPGRKKGHKGESHNNKAARNVRRAPKKCRKCGSKRIKRTGRTSTKLVLDIPEVPKAETVANVTDECRCKDCGAITGASEDPAGIPGTSIGPNLLRLALRMHYSGSTIQRICDVASMFGLDVSKAAMQHALDAAMDRMGPAYDGIRSGLKDEDRLNMDETPMPRNGRSGYAWVILGALSVFVALTTSRGTAVLEHYCPYTDKPVTVDGYAAYRIFRILQRCWAHILRESRDAASGGGPGLERLHHMLKQVFADAKELQREVHSGTGPGRPDPGPGIALLESRVMAIAGRYESAGCPFGGKLRRAAPNLFTFVRYEGMDPTNNAAERALRRLVIYRRLSYGVRNEKGMRRLSVLYTCMMTWEKRGLDVDGMLKKVLGGT